MTLERAVLNYMTDYGSITTLDGIKIGTVDLRKIISELRGKGVPIGDRWEEGINRYGAKTRYKRYYLIKENEDGRTENVYEGNNR